MEVRKLTAVITVLMAASSMAAALDLGLKCQAGKDEVAGKLAACLSRAQKKSLLSGDSGARALAIDSCAAAFARKWRRLEQTAVDRGTQCPTMNDEGDVHDLITACSDAVANAVAGNPLPVNPLTCATDLSACTASRSGCEDDLVGCGVALSECNAHRHACDDGLDQCESNLLTCSADRDSCLSNLLTCNAGTATPDEVLGGATFSSSAGLGITGTMPNQGAVVLTPGTVNQAIAAGYHDGSGYCAGDENLVAANIKNGVSIFGVTGTLQLPKTGQTTSHGPGSDGDVQAGAALSYTDNGDGTITDNVTGLMWEKKDDSGGIHDVNNVYSWGMTLAPYTMNGTMVTTFLAALNSGAGFAGHTDWRIPNYKELTSILNLEKALPATSPAFHQAATCLNCSDVTLPSCSCGYYGSTFNYYWTSTSRRDFQNQAWYVDFGLGNVVLGNKDRGYAVRAVRGGL